MIANPTVAEPKNPSIATARFRILVADDDAGNRETLAKLLQDRGFEPVVAKDGAEAVQIAQVKLIHLAIFDMHMPRLTGLEALQVVRQIHQLLPAILMTADATRGVLQQALQAKVHSVIPKPVNANLILEQLKKALQQVYPQQTPARPFPETEIPFV
jgi:CheY-like chemotaxis protein